MRHLPLAILLAAPVQLLVAFLLLSLYGSLLSICLPLRVAAGSLKPTKVPATRTFLLVFSSFFSVVVAAPVILPALLALVIAGEANPRAAELTLLFSVAELALLAALYPFGLRRLGALFQRREKEILQIVTQEVE